MHRVVITGLGAISPLGNSVEESWTALKNNESGIDTIKAFDSKEIGVYVAGEIKDFDPGLTMDRKEYARMDDFSKYAVAAAVEAHQQSGYDIEANPEGVGVIIGSGIGGIRSYEEGTYKYKDKGPRRVSPMFALMVIGNMGAANVALRLGAQNQALDVVTACASGTDSIGEAYLKIKLGMMEAAIAGGAEAGISPVTLSAFSNLTALSNNPDPKTASRPFDKERDGFVFGEGGAVVFMETLESAQARGAEILAEVVGYGSNNDAYHQTAPRPDGSGAGKVMLQAMEMAGIQAEDIDYINAHGTSTPTNDAAETASIKYALGEHAYRIPVSSTKGATGHLLGAAGGIEAIFAVKALQEGFVPATLGLENADEACDLDYVPGQGRPDQDLKYAVSNSLGFGGHNASLIFKRWDGE